MSSWNPVELKRLIAEHTVVGYRVQVPLFARGTIERQIRPEKGGFIFYKVVADKPVPFKDFTQRMNVATKPMTLKQWREKFVKGTASLPAMAWDLREALEAGKKVSQADVVFRDLMDRGCIDIDQNVFCYTFPSEDVFIAEPESGQLVEVVEGKHRGPSGWPGLITGFDLDNALAVVQEFSPVPYMRTPEALLPAAVKKSYTMPVTWTFGEGLAKALEKVGVGLPPGQWSEDREDYVLDKPIPLSEIEAFCEDPRTWKKLGQGKNIFCLQQAMMLHTLPLIMEEVSFRPLPEGTPPEDVVVSIADIEELEAEHIEWPGEEEPEEV